MSTCTCYRQQRHDDDLTCETIINAKTSSTVSFWCALPDTRSLCQPIFVQPSKTTYYFSTASCGTSRYLWWQTKPLRALCRAHSSASCAPHFNCPLHCAQQHTAAMHTHTIIMLMGGLCRNVTRMHECRTTTQTHARSAWCQMCIRVFVRVRYQFQIPTALFVRGERDFSAPHFALIHLSICLFSCVCVCAQSRRVCILKLRNSVHGNRHATTQHTMQSEK